MTPKRSSGTAKLPSRAHAKAQTQYDTGKGVPQDDAEYGRLVPRALRS